MKIEVKNISFGHNLGEKILENFNHSIPEGVFGILGQSGCGKSTLLRIIGGLLRPDEGDILINGESVWKNTIVEKKKMSKKIGMVFQGGALFDFLNVEGNLKFAMDSTGVEKGEWDSKIEKILESVGLDNVENIRKRFVSQLSGGQARRVGLARTLVTSPEIMLFDEPTTGLDPQRSRSIIEIIKSSLSNSKISIIVSHDIAFISEVCTQAILIEDGVVGATVDNKNLNKIINSEKTDYKDANLRKLSKFIKGLPT